MSNLQELGVALKAYRVAAEESVDDLADAMEIEPGAIVKYEAGIDIPTLETIELIGNHFSLRENEVKRLLELAGHDTKGFEFEIGASDIDLKKLTNQYDVLFAPIFYTDMVNVVSNKYGITINFIQNANGEDKPVVVSRVGMSHEHAESIMAVLAESIRRAKQGDKNQEGQTNE